MGFENIYEKNCPFCNKKFIANHLSRIYCTEKCKRRMFRKKKQDKKRLKNEDRKALELNDLLLDELYTKRKTSYTKAELEDVKFNPHCYDRRFKIENYIIYTLKDYLLLELPERVFKIYKSY